MSRTLTVAALGVSFVLVALWLAAVVVAWPHTETFGPDTYVVVANHPIVADCSGRIVVNDAC